MKVGDILFLDSDVPGLPYPTGYWVLCAMKEAQAEIALVSEDAKGLYAIDNRYSISVEDLGAFKVTSATARIAK